MRSGVAVALTLAVAACSGAKTEEEPAGADAADLLRDPGLAIPDTSVADAAIVDPAAATAGNEPAADPMAGSYPEAPYRPAGEGPDPADPVQSKE
ncbi:hypothetical protein [Thermaurantiacus sp.]